MNKNHRFTASIQDIEDSTNRFYESAAFGAIHFDGVGQETGIHAALTILEDAHAQCLELYMHNVEVEQACDYLAKKNDKARPLVKRFWDALVIEDQHTRFEATSQVLRVIRQQFGV